MTLAAPCVSLSSMFRLLRKVTSPTRNYKAWPCRQLHLSASAYSSSGRLGSDKAPIKYNRDDDIFHELLSYGAASVVLDMKPETVTVLSSNFLSGLEKDPNLILIILNWSISPLTAKIWNCASVRICADGGANRLYDEAPKWNPNMDETAARLLYTPDIIKGDMDSIRPDVKQFYESHSVRVVDLRHDQDTTDLQKCLACAERKLETPLRIGQATIVAIGGLGGRLDHTMSNLNMLYNLRQLRIVLCGDGNLARLVPAGRTTIQVERSIEGPACGLVALGAPARVTTTGLKWNCEDLLLEIGGMQSTSNVLASSEVTVDTTEPLIWTVELQEDGQ